MFFPYSLNLRLYGMPFFTVLLGTLCFLIFTIQVLSEKQYINDTQAYCKYDLTDESKTIFNKIGGSSVEGCISFFIELDHSNDLTTDIEFFSFKAQISEEEQNTITKEYDRFNSIVTNNFTSEFWHNPLNSEYTHYFTSSILHGDVEHLVFNLIFFFAFAITLEQTIGSILFLAFCALCCVTTGISYEQGFLGAESGVLPTIGLSGVVSGIMGFCLVVYPLKKVNVFYWFLIAFGTIKIPLLIVVGFFIASDLYGLKYLMSEDNVNYISHVSGTTTGVLCGGLYLLYKFIYRKLVSSQN